MPEQKQTLEILIKKSRFFSEEKREEILKNINKFSLNQIKKLIDLFDKEQKTRSKIRLFWEKLKTFAHAFHEEILPSTKMIEDSLKRIPKL